jgi:asparagine synthase (glutamine-hydrolysing)
MANSLEVRVPFLDKQFLQLAMGIAPEHKRPRPEPGKSGGKPVEKWLLRKAFERPVSELSWKADE